MKKLKTAIVNNPGSGMIEYVYSPEQLKILAEITDLMPGIYSLEDVRAGKLAETEALFSTWAIPPFEQADIDRMPKLQALFYAAGATDSFARLFFARGIKVFSAWQANAIPVAEFCTAQIILGLKGYFRCVREQPSRDKFFGNHAGPGIYGDTVALIGAGAISTRIKQMLENYRINVIVVPSRKEKRTVSLEEAFSKAFVISSHLPDRDDNVGVIDGRLFRSMREGAVFINTGRGRQINEADLVTVMRERPDLTALLDVTYPEPPPLDSPLYHTPNILVSPHIAGSLNDEVHRMVDYMLDEYRRFVNGEQPLYEVSESMLLTSK